DTEKIRKYDRFGHDWQQVDASERVGANVGGFRTSRAGPRVDFGYGPGSDADGFGDLFEQLFGGRRGRPGGRRSGPVRGQDVDQPVSISLEEAFTGTERTVRVRRPDGSPQALEVKIPAGVTEGSRVRVAGKGSPG